MLLNVVLRKISALSELSQDYFNHQMVAIVEWK